MQALKIANRSVVDIMDIHKHDVGKRRSWTNSGMKPVASLSTVAASSTIRIRRPKFPWGAMSPEVPCRRIAGRDRHPVASSPVAACPVPRSFIGTPECQL